MRKCLQKIAIASVIGVVLAAIPFGIIGCDDSISLPENTPLEPAVQQPEDPETTPPEYTHIHSLEFYAGEPATCMSAGFVDYWHCAECDKNFSDENAVEVIADITILAKEHSHTEFVIVKAATCTENGEEERVCGTCREKEVRVIPAFGHDYTDTVIEPTCTSDGYTLHKCSRCDSEYADNQAPSTGHSYAAQFDFDEQYHWHDLLCGCDIGDRKSEHEFIDGTCECGYAIWEFRLVFERNGDEYTVVCMEVAATSGSAVFDVVIPSEYDGLAVTAIASGAFKSNKNIKSVYIPKTVKRIGKEAFADSALSSAKFEDKLGWSVSISEDKKGTKETLGTDKYNADLLTKTKGTGKAAYYWICK